MIRINLSRLLGERKLTQKYLSDKTGIRPNTIGEYYHELIERVSLEHIDKICEVLDCSLEDLIQREAGERAYRVNEILRNKKKG